MLSSGLSCALGPVYLGTRGTITPRRVSGAASSLRCVFKYEWCGHLPLTVQAVPSFLLRLHTGDLLCIPFVLYRDPTLWATSPLIRLFLHIQVHARILRRSVHCVSAGVLPFAVGFQAVLHTAHEERRAAGAGAVARASHAVACVLRGAPRHLRPPRIVSRWCMRSFGARSCA